MEDVPLLPKRSGYERTSYVSPLLCFDRACIDAYKTEGRVSCLGSSRSPKPPTDPTLLGCMMSILDGIRIEPVHIERLGILHEERFNANSSEENKEIIVRPDAQSVSSSDSNQAHTQRRTMKRFPRWDEENNRRDIFCTIPFTSDPGTSKRNHIVIRMDPRGNAYASLGTLGIVDPPH